MRCNAKHAAFPASCMKHMLPFTLGSIIIAVFLRVSRGGHGELFDGACVSTGRLRGNERPVGVRQGDARFGRQGIPQSDECLHLDNFRQHLKEGLRQAALRIQPLVWIRETKVLTDSQWPRKSCRAGV